MFVNDHENIAPIAYGAMALKINDEIVKRFIVNTQPSILDFELRGRGRLSKERN